MPFSPSDFLREIRRRGATRVARVCFRDNRSTLWSLTQRGRVLNLHSAYRNAPEGLVDAFALLAKEGGVGSAATRRAAEVVRSWAPLEEEIQAARARHEQAGGRNEEPYCCATDAQRAYLRSLYHYFNQTRFAAALPSDLPVRLSRRMTSALGHMLPGPTVEGQRTVTEIALNIDLMLAENAAERIDTLLHEMAHAADYLESGHRGHGASWRRWAVRVGCRPIRLQERPVQQRASRDAAVTRVPPLPAPLRVA